AAPAAPAAPRPSALPEAPFAQVFAELAARLSGVVVNISTTKTVTTAPQKGGVPAPGSPLDEFFRDFFGEKGAPGGPNPPAPEFSSLGSGFIIDPSGLIVTNDHVIANAAQINVTLSDDTRLKAEVIGRDSVTDLALLKVDAKKPLPAASWGDSAKARVGDWVLAIGNPFGLGGTVTAGIISATARDIHSGPYDDFLQTDASINRGNSGGPMFNLAGQVIGINTAIFSPSGGSIGIGFAIPASFARPIIDQLKATGKVERGWIGARIQPVTEDIADAVGLDKSHGAMIAAIDPGSPAAEAKLEPGDVILAYEGQAIDRSRELPRLVAATPPGKRVTLVIWRDGRKRQAALKVAALGPNHPPAPPEPPKPKPTPSVAALGLELSRLTPALRRQFSLPEEAKGVVITAVPASGPGAAQGLKPGDLIIAVGREPVATPQQIEDHAAAAQKKGRKELLVRIQRDASTRFIALPVAG
ncbi:MAG TPA: DegQ family serine endoprotease, partial [Stellaceae bacterium]|nr:DegQ family serine endoprotease [Stellaceae bacterium]